MAPRVRLGLSLSMLWVDDMSEQTKSMYAIYYDAIDGGIFARLDSRGKPSIDYVVRLCTVAAHDAVEAFDVFIALEGIDYVVPTGV